MLKLDAELQNELDSQMQEGYKLMMAGDSMAASRVWVELWGKITKVMDQLNVESIEDMDTAFKGTQCISNWASDLEMELGNASREDKDLAQSRIHFCSEYVARSKDKSDLNVLNMKRAVAETLFQLGHREEGESLFAQYLEESPNWGWGWIGWSDMYGLFANPENKNNERAIHILKQALEIEDLEDRLDVLERLSDLYTSLEMTQEASEVNQSRSDYMKAKQYHRSMASLSAVKEANPVTSVKIGRNDPCSCGSGKKFKKCCGM